MHERRGHVPGGGAAGRRHHGRRSDWETMRHAADTLDELGVPHEVRVVSAHRTPDLLFEYAAAAEGRGLEVIIAGAGGAAHLPGMTARQDGCCRCSACRSSRRRCTGVDSLLSIVQMPAGVPVGDAGHRPGRGRQRRAAGRGHPGQQVPASSARALRSASARRQTQAVLDHPDPRSRGAHDGRRPRRRAAGADAGPGRLPARPALPLPRSGPARRPPGTCAELIVGALRRPRRRWTRFADGLDVVTYEFENVPVAAARYLARARRRSTRRPRRWKRPRIASPRRRFFPRLGIPTPPFAAGAMPSAICTQRLRQIGLPAVLKTRRCGYDGKGQCVIRSRPRSTTAWQALGGAAADPGRLRAVRPRAVDLAVRGRDGATACYPLVENHHASGILRLSLAPAPGLTPALQAQAEAIRRRGAGALGLRRRAGDRVLPGGRAAAGERDGPARPQLRPLDHRGGGDEPVREPPAGGGSGWPLGATEARGGQRDAQPDRHAARPGGGAGRARCRTCTSTARSRARGGSSATSRSGRTIRRS